MSTVKDLIQSSGGLDIPFGEGWDTPGQRLQTLGFDPSNLNATIPDPLKGSLMPDKSEMGGWALALAPLAAGMIGAGAAGAGGVAEEAAALGVGPAVSGTQGLTAGSLYGGLAEEAAQLGVGPEVFGTQGLDTLPGTFGGVPSVSPGGFNPLNQLNRGAQQATSIDPVTGQPALQPPGSPTPPTAPSAPGSTGPLGPGATTPPGVQQAGTSFVDKILADMKAHPINAAGLGLSAAGMLAQGRPKQPAQVGQLGQLGTTGQQTAQQLLDQYKSGQLSGPQQASLQQLSQNARNQINNYFASIRQSDSTAHQQALAQVDQQAESMKNEMLQQALNSGLQAIGVAAGPLNNVAQYTLGQDRNLQAAFANFANALGNFGGRGAQQNANPTQQTQPTQQNTGT